jgi:hypothetical protein
VRLADGVGVRRGEWACGRCAARARAALLCAGLLAGAACAPPAQIEHVQLVLRELEGCTLASPNSIQLRALGDFPSQSAPLQEGSSDFDGFPLDTRELEVRAGDATQRAAGRYLLTHAGSAQPVWVLPAARSCPLGDQYARALDGAAVAALPTGGLLISGGVDDAGQVRSEASTLAPGELLVQPVASGMLLRRAYASATSVGSWVVIAGGAGDLRGGGAHYTYEVFDSASGNFAGGRSGQLQTGPRMQHAALALPDGRVLLVGGRAEPGGPPLASAEIFDAASGEHAAISGNDGLSDARVAPVLLRLDSGSVIALGGSDAEGATLGSVERFELATPSFTPLPIALPQHSELVAAALPGARVAWLGCDTGAAAGCELGLLLEQAGEFVREDVALDFSELAPRGLSDLRLVALESGRLLLTASDRSDAATHRRAFVIDLNVPALTQLEASRVPSQLLVLRTGQVAELDALGASLREYESLSDYESPQGNLVTDELALLALDAPSHWSHDAGALTARVLGARLDVPKLRFEALQVQLDVEGDASLSFVTDAGERFGAELTAGQLLSQGCTAALPEGAQLVATLDSQHLTLRSDAGARLCEVGRPAGAVRVNLRLAEGTRLRGFTLQRH